ncbi:MAG: sce7725 family protein [Pseudomonadota bacterium]
MYYPYFRGKQNELILLKELSEKMSGTGNVLPIIEPVKENLNGLKRCLAAFKNSGLKCILITNPNVGEFDKDNALIKDFILNEAGASESIVYGIILDQHSVFSDISAELASLNSFALIHLSHVEEPKLYADLSKDKENEKIYQIFFDEPSRRIKKYFEFGQQIIVKDGFSKQEKNSKYPAESFFSDWFEFYQPDFKGYGDFSIVGNNWTSSGGPAWAVAIHLTYPKNEEEIWTRHYVSDTQDSPSNPGGKFKEALQKLIDDIDNLKIASKTEAIKEFIELHRRQHFPGLGVVKKLSMQHHLELNMILNK